MQDEIKRLKEMLTKEDPRTPNYKSILDNLSGLLLVMDLYAEPGCDGECDCACVDEELPRLAEKPRLVEKPAPVVVEEPTPTEGAEEDSAPIVEEPPAPEYTIEEVRAAVKAAQTRGVDVRPFIAAYGVKNLSGVPKESFGELIEAVTNA